MEFLKGNNSNIPDPQSRSGCFFVLVTPHNVKRKSLTTTEEKDTYYYVYVDYSAENSFGGNSRETMIMKLDYGVSDFCVVEVVGGAAYVMNYKTTDEGWRWVIQTII